MTEVILRYREARAGERGLFPVEEEGEELLGKLRVGRDVGCDVKRRRNPRHHRLFFAILKFCQMHCPTFEGASIEQIKDAVKLATGYATKYIEAETGQVYYVVKSIAWAAMDQTEFEKFFEAACSVIANRWMPAGVTPELVRYELLLMVDGPMVGEPPPLALIKGGKT